MMQNTFKTTPRIEDLNKDIDLMWYPKAGYTLVSHIEMNVNGRVWDANRVFKNKTSYEVSERNALAGGKSFYRFKLRVSEAELTSLDHFLAKQSHKPGSQSCISGACTALNLAEIMYIPPPFSRVPTLNAIYWRLRKLTGSRRIESITFVGKNQLATLTGFEIPFELTMSASVVGFVTIAFYTGKTLVQKLIPIFRGDSEDDVERRVIKKIDEEN